MTGIEMYVLLQDEDDEELLRKLQLAFKYGYDSALGNPTKAVCDELLDDGLDASPYSKGCKL